MNEQKLQNYLHNETVERVKKELLDANNIDLINKELPTFKSFLIENKVRYFYKTGIVYKGCNWNDFHSVYALRNEFKCEGIEELYLKINEYKTKIQELFNRHISWSEFGMLINSIQLCR